MYVISLLNYSLQCEINNTENQEKYFNVEIPKNIASFKKNANLEELGDMIFFSRIVKFKNPFLAQHNGTYDQNLSNFKIRNCTTIIKTHLQC